MVSLKPNKRRRLQMLKEVAQKITVFWEEGPQSLEIWWLNALTSICSIQIGAEQPSI
jgi:hypothetical protein